MAYYHWLSILLIGVLFFAFRGSSQGVCPKTWLHIRRSCYKISSRSLNWKAAKSACEALGSKLAMVKSQAELQALVPKLSNNVWIGLYRDPKDTSRWLWVDGTRVTYTHWNQGEPNNHQGTFEGCGHMFPPAGYWNDAQCHSSYRYLCEVNAKCQKLSLGKSVRVSPSHCSSSNQVYGSTCSFSCAGGHRLSGPSSTQCGKEGIWSGKVNTVSCRAVKCPALTVRRLVKTSPSNCVTSQMKYNTNCSFACPHSYHLHGPSYKQCKEDGQWTENSKTVSCNLVKCPALTVTRLVKTLPSSCVTSKMNYNTKCSFTCSQGYQLQGPSSIQCKANGRWTHSAKTVACVDIDECSLTRNGGCSHKCVNTAGSHKCECPDPELSLSLDNRTCHAPDVDVQCNSNNMTIIIPKSLLRGLDREHLRLLDSKCKAKETSGHFSLTTSLAGCKTTRRHTGKSIVYSNVVLEIPIAAKDVITRVRETKIKFSCFYSKYGVVSSVGWKPSNRKLVFSDEGKGNFSLSLNMFPDKRFVSPYMKDDFPVALVLRKRLFFEVSVTSSDKQLSIIADQCYATPTQSEKNSLKYEFITKGCPSDVTVKYHTAASARFQRFSLEAFKFIADHPFVFVHCHVIVCNASDPGSKCAKGCPSNGRGRRATGDYVADDKYSLVQGPLYLTREKRQENNESAARSGSSPALIMVLFVMCIACLAGTALMAFKKARVQSIGYTALPNGNQE